MGIPPQCSAAKELFMKSQQNCPSNKSKSYCVFSPARVNLIGEHVDYTSGVVLPLAISNLGTGIYGTGSIQSTSNPDTCTLSVNSSSFPSDGIVTISLSPFPAPSTSTSTSTSTHPTWVNYVLAPLAQYLTDLNLASSKGNLSFNLSLSLHSDIPLGGGLSSSASLMVGIGRFLESVFSDYNSSSPPPAAPVALYGGAPTEGAPTEVPVARAVRAKAAENGPYVNSPCGIMDQFIISTAAVNHLCLIKCGGAVGGEIVEMVPFGPFGGNNNNTSSSSSSSSSSSRLSSNQEAQAQPVLIVCNSGVSHSIAGGEYAKRVAECEVGRSNILGSTTSTPLSDATMDDFNSNPICAASEPPIWVKRARHVISENSRVYTAVAHLKAGEWAQLGAAMNASHDSLSTDYEVSCTELDLLVDVARSAEGGIVYGSRMTGGGFGGCTISLVEGGGKEVNIMENIQRTYKEKSGFDCKPFIIDRPGGGVESIETNPGA